MNYLKLGVAICFGGGALGWEILDNVEWVISESLIDYIKL